MRKDYNAKQLQNRRTFLKTSVIGGLAAASINPLKAINSFLQAENESAKVSLTTGSNRADMVFRALRPFARQIRESIGDRRIIIKPNNVLIHVPLASTHVETLEGILEFLKSINKLQNVIIAESSASSPTLNGFENYGYFKLLSKYPVKFMDLDGESYNLLYVIDQKDLRPHAVRVSSLILDPDSYVISVARMKTHNTVVATLSLKNIVFGAPIKDKGFTLYSEDKRFNSQAAVESKEGTVSYKRLLHGSGTHAVNYNLYSLARQIHPHLAVIDGFEGMEGNGPTLGTPVDHRVCVVSQDWLAADRVGIELMGIDFTRVGYLNYCAQTGLGVADLNKIEIIGENLADHIKTYKLPDNIDRQMMWMSPVS
jgi:uncharacterized protein (DUF362 family)